VVADGVVDSEVDGEVEDWGLQAAKITVAAPAKINNNQDDNRKLKIRLLNT
jgi:hypothetical protein